MSNNIIGNNMNPSQNIGTTAIAGTVSGVGTVPSPMMAVSGHQQSLPTPMEVDSNVRTPVMTQPSLPSLPSLSSSNSPGLGNLQSVVGAVTTNVVTTASIAATSTPQHSSLVSALQGSTSSINTSINNSTSGSSIINTMASTQSTLGSQVKSSSTSSAPSLTHDVPSLILTRPRLQDLVREVDPTEQLDEEVEELLLQLADDFVESTVSAACLLAKHRKASTIEVKDVQLHLERQWNMWLPGFGTDELRPYKRAPVTEAHKQRLAIIRKALKKY